MKYIGHKDSFDNCFPALMQGPRGKGMEPYILCLKGNEVFAIDENGAEIVKGVGEDTVKRFLDKRSWIEIENPFTDRAETKKLLEEILKEFDAMMDRPEISYPSLLINKIKEAIEKL